MGRGLGTVECRKTVLAVHAPVSFIIAAGNDAAEEHPAVINRDPYGAGWMACGRPPPGRPSGRACSTPSPIATISLPLEPEATFD